MKIGRRRGCVALLIAEVIVCSAVFAYLYSYIRTRNGTNVKTLSVIAHTSSEHQHQQPRRHGVVKVHSAGNFTDRVAAFNTFLASLRVEELTVRANDAWQRPTSGRLDVVGGARDDYLHLLSNYTSVVTVALPWLTKNPGSPRAWSSLQDHSNLLLQTYYAWTADDTLCTWIETPGNIKHKYDVLYNRTCNRNIKDTVLPMPLEPVFLNGKPISPRHYLPKNGSSYPEHFYKATPPYVFHMHIHRDAIVTRRGDVITDGLEVILHTCGYVSKPYVPLIYSLRRIPLYNELYVINQRWGHAIFHRMVEIVPRLSLHLQFLKAHPEIRILAPEVGGRLAELIEIIGLEKSRLVTGVRRAKIVYQPRATGCGTANVQESQVLSQLYRDYIKRTFPAQPRNRLILIRRSGLRRFTEQNAIEEVVAHAARDYNLTYTLFPDNPTPSLKETMMMFHSAVVVVGPHGAGLSNVYFSQPGTYVLEGVCNLPHVNLCFQWLAHVLGHRWHGVTSRGGCEDVVDVPASHINTALREYLSLLLKRPI